MQAKLFLLDEVNCKFEGLQPHHIKEIVSQTSKFVKGAQNNASYQLGVWDGRESQFSNDGFTFIYMLDQVFDIIIKQGYKLEVVDYRDPIAYTPDLIDDTFLEYAGVTLRDYQVQTVNSAITHQKGVLSVATSGGKTFICGAIAKVYDPAYRSITIVPSESLVKQTAKDYEKLGLDVGVIYGKITEKQREKMWQKRHIVATWQTLQNCRERLHAFHVVLFDECHVCGDVMFSILPMDLGHAHIRIGLTGTFCKDKHKAEKICCRLGGDVLERVAPKTLMDKGKISQISITMHQTVHDIELPDNYDWEVERKYSCTNKLRLKAIADFIGTLPVDNTLILCHAELGSGLQSIMQLDYIDQNASSDFREECYAKYSNRSDYRLIATYGTVGTGISIDDIFNLVMIDVGKDETAIIQGIGRAVRLDTEGRHAARAWDIYSGLKSSLRHHKERCKIYRQYQYPHTEGVPIFVSS